jgi:hypothetical protein
MYEDNESIKVFERQHARDRMAQLARNPAEDADLDLMTVHAAGSQHSLLIAALCVTTIAFLAALVVVYL